MRCAVAEQRGRVCVCVRTDFDGCFGLIVCIAGRVWCCGDFCDESGASGGLLMHGDQIGAERGVGCMRGR